MRKGGKGRGFKEGKGKEEKEWKRQKESRKYSCNENISSKKLCLRWHNLYEFNTTSGQRFFLYVTNFNVF